MWKSLMAARIPLLLQRHRSITIPQQLSCLQLRLSAEGLNSLHTEGNLALSLTAQMTVGQVCLSFRYSQPALPGHSTGGAAQSKSTDTAAPARCGILNRKGTTCRNSLITSKGSGAATILKSTVPRGNN